MTYQPIVPFGGNAGWSFLRRTQEAQQAAFNASPDLERDAEYFKENISKVQTAREVVNDFRLLKVALGAFGLDEDIANKAFIEKVLEEGSLDPESFANRMVDKRYLALTEAFGFDLGTPNTILSGFPDKILDSYKSRQFEIAVGKQDNSMRLAMSLERDLGDIVEKPNTPDGKWFSVMGNEPLREVFETALGLPKTLGSLDIDRQLDVFRKRAETVLGSAEIDQFSKPEKMHELNRLYLAKAQIQTSSIAYSPSLVALTLLQSS